MLHWEKQRLHIRDALGCALTGHVWAAYTLIWQHSECHNWVIVTGIHSLSFPRRGACSQAGVSHTCAWSHTNDVFRVQELWEVHPHILHCPHSSSGHTKVPAGLTKQGGYPHCLPVNRPKRVPHGSPPTKDPKWRIADFFPHTSKQVHWRPTKMFRCKLRIHL